MSGSAWPVFVVAVVRLVSRAMHATPPAPDMPRSQAGAAHLTRFLQLLRASSRRKLGHVLLTDLGASFGDALEPRDHSQGGLLAAAARDEQG
jgi:hypothetical protein